MSLDQDSLEHSNGTQAEPGGSTHPRTLSRLVEGKNINPETLLATDYLNHFNEIIMLLDMVPTMPDCFEDAKAWSPKSYEEHFRDSSFADKDLAILAYQNAPEKYRTPFDKTIQRMNLLVIHGVETIEEAIATGEQGRIELAVTDVSRTLQSFVDRASAIIHGDADTMDQSEVDAILGS